MLLLAVGSCFDAFLLAPVLAVLRTRGVTFRVACAATAHELGDLRELLGCPADERELPVGPAGVAVAHAFADELVATPPVAVATIGSGAFVGTLAGRAIDRDIRLVRLDAGVRPDREELRACWFCVASDYERAELIGRRVHRWRVQVVGDLVATALAASPIAAEPDGAGEPPFLWLALEHADSLPHHQRDLLAAAVAGTGLPARTAARTCRDFAAWHAGSARDQLRLALLARVIVTDSLGYQRLAVAAGIPCVVLPGTRTWPRGAAEGLVSRADRGPDGLLAALVHASRHPRRPLAAAPGVAERSADWLVTELAPVPRDLTLPSDADASGRTFDDDEIALVTSVLRRGSLNSTRGTFVTTFERRFAQWLGRKHAIACASGSAAVHGAIATLRLAAGDEVITTPITDMGAITPILYEGGVPVFADVDPTTLNVTAATLQAQITNRTRAIVVTHLFGLPCEMEAILQLAHAHGLAVIEDAAQAFGATLDGRKVGTFGRTAAFSLQQGKHITCGEGGIVATDDDEIARRVFLFVNKAWGYGDATPDHYFPALNYRLTELQGAVLVAQLPKLDCVVARRRVVAAQLRDRLAGVPGISLPGDPPHGTHAWWKFAFFVDADTLAGGGPALAKKMQAAGVACAPRYIQKPAFECALFEDWRRSPVTAMPLQNNPRRDATMPLFRRADYPGAVRALDRVVVLPINERYTEPHVANVASVIRAAAAELQRA
jgi:dTDP-4-amino-4,6-dideoxygalactose transaminase